MEPPVVINTSQNVGASIIWLHGLGADGHDFESIVPELRLPAEIGIRFIFPHASVRPVTINGGYEMRAWYDIKGQNIEDKADEEGILESSNYLNELIEKEIQAGVKSERIILAGFSQGGAVALYAGLRSRKKLGGLMILSSYLPLPEKLAAEKSEENKEVPIFMAHGLQDQVVPMNLGLLSKEELEKHGYRPEWNEYMMPHAVCAEEIQDISDWLKKVLKF